MTEDEMIARGKDVFQACYDGVVELPAQIDPKGLSGLSMKMFNDIWGNPTLSFREKRLVVMGCLAGLGADPSLFTIHATSALRNGEMDAAELLAVVLTLVPYAGYPRVSPLYRVAENVIASVGKQVQAAAP